MEWPVTASGWLQVLALITTLLTAWTGVVVALAKRYINQTVGDVVRTSVDAAMQPVQLQLVTMNGELVRVRDIEAKIENGLSQRQERIEKTVDAIADHLMWDGRTERRDRR